LLLLLLLLLLFLFLLFLLFLLLLFYLSSVLDILSAFSCDFSCIHPFTASHSNIFGSLIVLLAFRIAATFASVFMSGAGCDVRIADTLPMHYLQDDLAALHDLRHEEGADGIDEDDDRVEDAVMEDFQQPAPYHQLPWPVQVEEMAPRELAASLQRRVFKVSIVQEMQTHSQSDLIFLHEVGFLCGRGGSLSLSLPLHIFNASTFFVSVSFQSEPA
jgi:hypothetical protein